VKTTGKVYVWKQFDCTKVNSEFGDHVTRSKLLACGEKGLGTVEVILVSITAAIEIRVNQRLNGNVLPQSDGICCKCGKKGGQTSNDDGEDFHIQVQVSFSYFHMNQNATLLSRHI